MRSSYFHDFGSDEQRAIEGIAAMLDIYPREEGEDDESLAWRMADWALLQGPAVRWHAMLHVSRAMVEAKKSGMGFMKIARVGSEAMKEFNQLYGGI